MSFTLYDYALSANCYKIRLFASILGVEYERVAVGFYPAREHKSQKMLHMSPAGTLPILVSGNMVLSETAAMLYWMAHQFDGSGDWFLNTDVETQSLVLEWMGFAKQLNATIGAARLQALFQTGHNRPARDQEALKAMRQIESHLTEQEIDGFQYLGGRLPTIADIACFPLIALSPDMGLEHDGFPAVRNWLYAIRSLKGFIPMPGIYAMHELRDHETNYGQRDAIDPSSNACG